MHHYSTITSLSITTISNVQKVFQEHIPRVAIQHRVLFHAILSVTATHLSMLLPLEGEKYQLLCRKQNHLALLSMRQGLADICDDNRNALFAAGCLIAIITFSEFSQETGENYLKPSD
jgi:hypothetical protein